MSGCVIGTDGSLLDAKDMEWYETLTLQSQLNKQPPPPRPQVLPPPFILYTYTNYRCVYELGLHCFMLIGFSVLHRYGYTCGFHTGLAVGTGTGTRLPTRQKPIPIPVMVMCMAQPNMVSHASHLCFLAFTTTSRPCRVSILTFLLFYRSYTKVSTPLNTNN